MGNRNAAGLKGKAMALAIEKRAFIDGVFTPALNGSVIERPSPIDNSRLDGLAACGAADVDRAVAAAKRCFESRIWLDRSLQEKKDLLFTLADHMEQNREELALLDTLETGRAFRNYYYDSIPKAIKALRYFVEAVDKHYGSVSNPDSSSIGIMTREALGVVGIITPWNDPMVVSMWKLAPALLMGNSVVMKPAEQSSYSMLKVAALASSVGLPDGLLNVIPGYGEVAGRALALHQDVRGIFFTGSSEVGKKIMQYAGKSNMKKVGLECGGKSAFIVSDKCHDISRAAAVLAQNMFYNQGQICSAPSRAIVHRKIKDEFLALLKAEMHAFIPADPFDTETAVGCVVSWEQKVRIQAYIDDGVSAGIETWTASPSGLDASSSAYILPRLFVTEDLSSPLVQEEIFGPVLVVVPVESMQDAVIMANNSRYGLAASIWSDDLEEVMSISQTLQAGIVHVNSYGDDDNSVPFGGIKESGIGKDKSIFAFDEYSYQKTTWMVFRRDRF